jgi:DNA repair exonuclease SbcCD ATPase subunit
MITFQKVSYKNFLAAGNSPITIDLNIHQSTLVVGHNGTGKSTLSEAICFALFGRPLRNINKPKLVNSINARDCLVELEFKTSSGNYRIRRGIKPNVFEVYENGTLIPSPASAADYQLLLETNILKLNYKSFMQVVVLGSASYVPFMRLTSSSRREIIEDLLDIEVFSAMNALAKDDLTALRNELDKLIQAKGLVGEQVRMAQNFTVHLEEQRQQQLVAVENNIGQVANTIATSTEEIVELQSTLATYDPYQQALTDATAKKSEYERNRFAIQAKLKELRKERAFYDENDSCPKCEQSLTDELKQGRYETLDSKEQGAQKALAQCDTLVAKYEAQIDAANTELAEASTIRQRIHGIQATLAVHKTRLAELQQERGRLQADSGVPPQAVDVEDLQRQLAELSQKHDDTARKRVIMDAAGMLLRDNGIKAKVIRHYIPIINRTINAYLTAMDFPIAFTLDEEFQEKIKSRYRDDFAYDSFSEGEKKRIDLALLLTWRAVARLKNSAASNLLILDEVFDSSLDANGTEEFLKIIAGLEKDTRVFVISHKTDQLVDKFGHTITFVKNRGFSEIKI